MGQISVQQKSNSTWLFKCICFWSFLTQCFTPGRFAYQPFLSEQIPHILFLFLFLVPWFTFPAFLVTIIYRYIILLRHHLNVYCIHPVGKLICTHSSDIQMAHNDTMEHVLGQWVKFLHCLFICHFLKNKTRNIRSTVVCLTEIEEILLINLIILWQHF